MSGSPLLRTGSPDPTRFLQKIPTSSSFDIVLLNTFNSASTRPSSAVILTLSAPLQLNMIDFLIASHSYEPEQLEVARKYQIIAST